MIKTFLGIMLSVIVCGCVHRATQKSLTTLPEELAIKQQKDSGLISVYRGNQTSAIIVQSAKQNQRPFIHPVIAPDGKGVLTQYRPEHHLHQTGIFWGLKMVNGRDYFMKWQSDYWRKISDTVLTFKGRKVQWRTIYDLLDEHGESMLTENATWSIQVRDNIYLIDLVWNGEAKTDITFGKFYVGGLFIRMPWLKGIAGEVINSNGQRNQEAEAQKAIWTDVGMSIEGRDDWGHFTVFDHPDNKDFPISWRVDNELGIGPSKQITGAWNLKKNERETVRYRIVVYTGKLEAGRIHSLWKEYACETYAPF